MSVESLRELARRRRLPNVAFLSKPLRRHLLDQWVLRVSGSDRARFLPECLAASHHALASAGRLETSCRDEFKTVGGGAPLAASHVRVHLDRVAGRSREPVEAMAVSGSRQ